MGRITSFFKRIAVNSIQQVCNRLYAPRDILKEGFSQSVDILSVQLDESTYQLAKVRKGRLFTNRVTNISVISHKLLVPSVSWQYSNGKAVPDAENDLLHHRILIFRPPRSINGTVVSLLTGGGGNNNYYHWLFDCLPRLRIAQAANLSGDPKYLIPEDTYPFQEETLEAIGIPAASRLSSKDYQHIQATELIATTHPNPDPSTMPSWIVEYLRDSFLDLSSPTIDNRFVYISRGDSTNSRRILNEDYLCPLLRSAGFGIYYLSELSFAEQVSLFQHARMIVGVHGAGFANLVFASEGAVVYEIFSDQYEPDMYERLSKLLGLDYRKIVCGANQDENPVAHADLRISDQYALEIVKHAELISSGDLEKR